MPTDSEMEEDDGPKSVGLSIPLDKDATISEGESITAFGNLETLTVDGSIGNRYDTLLSVNLGFLMAMPDYEKIILRLYLIEADGDYCGTFQTTLNPWWDENSVTWMNAGGANGANGEVLGDALVTQESDWVELDVTNVLAKMDAESKTLLSIRMFSNEESRCVFASRSGNAVQAPNLWILLKGREVDVDVDVEEATSATRRPR
jgi:hypothetical protein